MRHGKKFNHLGRTKSHRKAMLSNMACSLIQHKRINTTLAKAKALRGYVEPLITKSKDDSTHSRRVVFSHLNDKAIVAELFRDVAPKIAERPGGYTRIIKTGNRLGDNAEMCMMELVDFNELYTSDKKQVTKKKRSRRGSGATASTAAKEVSETSKKDVVENTSELKKEVEAETKTAEAKPEESKTVETKAEDTTSNADEAPKTEDENKDK